MGNLLKRHETCMGCLEDCGFKNMLDAGIQTYRLSLGPLALMRTTNGWTAFLHDLNFSHIPGTGVGALLSSRLEDKKSEGEGVFLLLDGGRRAKDRRQISNLPVMAFHQV